LEKDDRKFKKVNANGGSKRIGKEKYNPTATLKKDENLSKEPKVEPF